MLKKFLLIGSLFFSCIGYGVIPTELLSSIRASKDSKEESTRCIQTVKRMCDEGIDLNEEFDQNGYPMVLSHFAARYGSEAVTAYLVLKGANPAVMVNNTLAASYCLGIMPQYLRAEDAYSARERLHDWMRTIERVSRSYDNYQACCQDPERRQYFLARIASLESGADY